LDRRIGLASRDRNNFDYSLLFIIILLMAISIINIHSAQKYLPYHKDFAGMQLFWYAVGLIVTAVIYYFDLEQIKKLSLYIYLFGVFLLVVLFFAPESIAPSTKGIKAWFSIKGVGSVQPSEFMKIFLIMFLAKITVDHNDKNIHRTISTDMILIGKIVGITLVPLLFILLQPDAGTAMVILVIMFGVIFLSGVNWKILTIFFSTVLSAIGALVVIYIYYPDTLLLVLDQYQLNRIHSWLDPFEYSGGIGYQLSQSILAIGSGTNYGKGYMKGEVNIPEAHSDFIFSVVGEEYGFLGASVVVTLYFLLIYRIIVIAIKSKGEYESLIAAGVVSMLTFHIFENVGMVIGLVPITGIPLPLLSYGGSSILANMLSLTLILNISAKTKNYMFEGNKYA